MATKRILFLDDYPQASENHLFVQRLREKLKVMVVEEKTVRGFEDTMLSGGIDVLVLDIMMSSSKDLLDSNRSIVSSSMTGIELLKRCRAGQYGKAGRSMPIFMRTARGETYIRNLCNIAKATGFFQAGAEDSELIEAIREGLKIES
jgi:CheY-like chemotaxis protein